MIGSTKQACRQHYSGFCSKRHSFEEHVSGLVEEVLEKFEDVEIRRSLDFCATKFDDQLQD